MGERETYGSRSALAFAECAGESRRRPEPTRDALRGLTASTA
jgi:hypothetical protein